MKKYRVILETGASVAVTVEAEGEEAAIELAFEDAPTGVCAQCSGWRQKWSLDFGEWGTPMDREGRELPVADWVYELEEA